MSSSSQKGFTLVELLMAMAFFSFILLFATTGFIIVNRAYNKGLTVKLVQDEARSVMERFTREIRSTTNVEISPSGTCITLGGDSYYWVDRKDPTKPKSPRNLYWVREVPCASIVDPLNPDVAKTLPNSTPVSILNDRVGVQTIELTPFNSQIAIKIVLSTADVDLLEVDLTSGELSCTTAAGNQYCDLVELSTVVSTR